jgi:hypothetical protein
MGVIHRDQSILMYRERKPALPFDVGLASAEGKMPGHLKITAVCFALFLSPIGYLAPQYYPISKIPHYVLKSCQYLMSLRLSK